jgi:hypothetical protein
MGCNLMFWYRFTMHNDQKRVVSISIHHLKYLSLLHGEMLNTTFSSYFKISNTVYSPYCVIEHQNLFPLSNCTIIHIDYPLPMPPIPLLFPASGNHCITFFFYKTIFFRFHIRVRSHDVCHSVSALFFST